MYMYSMSYSADFKLTIHVQFCHKIITTNSVLLENKRLENCQYSYLKFIC